MGHLQRARKTRLTSEQIQLIDQIAFSWNAREDAWHARYQEAADYKNQHGNLNANYRTPLGAWLSSNARNTGTIGAGGPALVRGCKWCAGLCVVGGLRLARWWQGGGCRGRPLTS